MEGFVLLGLVYLVPAALIGLIPAFIAMNKGRSFLLWWIYGTLLFIVAFIHSLLASPNQPYLDEVALTSGTSKKCPRCAEIVKPEAQVCRFCGYDFNAPEERAPEALSPPETA